MDETQFHVKTHVFEGPLDTLLSLIEKRKLFINDISLAQVADDFIEHVKRLEGGSGDVMDDRGESFADDLTQNPNGSGYQRQMLVADLAHFILVASTLVLIKSKSLLPNLELTEEEQHNIEDLEARLREYQKYKTLAVHLKNKFGIHTEYFRLPAKDKTIIFAPDKNTTVDRMREVIHLVIAQMPKVEMVPKAIVKKVISLEEMIDNLTERITSGIKMSFNNFAGYDRKASREKRVEIIVGFLAMLELVRQGAIKVRQETDFDDIEMESEIVGVPRY